MHTGWLAHPRACACVFHCCKEESKGWEERSSFSEAPGIPFAGRSSQASRGDHPEAREKPLCCAEKTERGAAAQKNKSILELEARGLSGSLPVPSDRKGWDRRVGIRKEDRGNFFFFFFFNCLACPHNQPMKSES